MVVPNWLSVRSRRITPLIVAALVSPVVLAVGTPASALDNGRIPAGGVLRVTVPEAIGGKTVVGQLTVDRAVGAGYVTAYGCDDDIPTNTDGTISRSDLNYDGAVSPVASNRLIVKADNNGDVCFYTLRAVALIVDVNAVTFDTGVNSFPNRRTDTRTGPNALVAGGGVLRVSVPEAVGGKTVVGQLTVDRVVDAGFVTAYGCDGRHSRGPRRHRQPIRPQLRRSRVGGGVEPLDRQSRQQRRRVLLHTAPRGTRSSTSTESPTSASVRFPTSAPTLGHLAEPTRRRRWCASGIGSRGRRRQDRSRPTDRRPRALGAGYVTAYGCDDGIPTDTDGAISRSDLNYDGAVSAVASNRLIVKADDNGDVCFFTLRSAALVVDINGVSAVGISSFPNHRTDTRTQTAATRLDHLRQRSGVAAVHDAPTARRVCCADRSARRGNRHQPTHRGRQDRQLRRRSTAVGARASRCGHRAERRRDHPIRCAVPHTSAPSRRTGSFGTDR